MAKCTWAGKSPDRSYIILLAGCAYMQIDYQNRAAQETRANLLTYPVLLFSDSQLILTGYLTQFLTMRHLFSLQLLPEAIIRRFHSLQSQAKKKQTLCNSLLAARILRLYMNTGYRI